MPKIDDKTRLRHMLDAAKEASFFIQGKTRKSLDTDRMLTLSLVKLIEIIGIDKFYQRDRIYNLV